MSPYLKVEMPGCKAFRSEVAKDIGDDKTVLWGGPVELSGDSASDIKVQRGIKLKAFLPCWLPRLMLNSLPGDAAQPAAP